MEMVADGTSTTELLDLTDDILTSILLKLDLESLVMVGRATKKLKQVVYDDLVWMELCQAWVNLVNLRSWRAQMDSGKALYRLLRTLSKLTGLWSHRSYNPRGELLYVTWATGGLQGWQVTPGATDADVELRFRKLFEVVGKPDGSHEVELVFTGEVLDESLRLPAHIVLPSAQAKDQFVLERYHVANMQLTRSSNEYIGILSRPVKEIEIWRKLYKKLAIEDPRPGRELTGLWTGLYGPHGWEILTVSYTEIFIVATKVIGDPNVPSGEVTFKGFIGTETVDIPELFELHDESGRLTKMYRGEGRIAQENFLNPTWVPGALLVQQSGNFSFVWADVNFMIGFKRLDVEGSFRRRT